MQHEYEVVMLSWLERSIQKTNGVSMPTEKAWN